ncbi:MAG: AAA family ATPase [Chloroflexi bacterium]|nr:AAA family ATPase [Chloroflexota bacterium]
MADVTMRETTDDMAALLLALPEEIGDAIRALPNASDVIEVVMDLGRLPEARFGAGGESVLLDREITEADIEHVVIHVGSFGEDNRAGIERTLHRISAIRNRSGKIVGLTCRIGRAVFGTIEIIDDLVSSGKSVLIMGRPGIGKTTMLREAARVLAEVADKRVVVVDTSNEIAGDGDIPHPGIGRARRMQVRTPAHQHAVMIEAVENHMPEVIVIDEIGTELEAAAARTIAERGVQLIGTAHGNSLDNLMVNPTLSDLIGGIQTVTLGDEEARRRRTQKSVLERKAPPTFDVVVEIIDRDRVTVHADVAETVDGLLRGDPEAPELRWRDEGGVHKSQSRPRPGPTTQLPGERFGGLVGQGQSGWRVEPGWRPDARRGEVGPVAGGPGGDRGRSGYRPGASGGWRSTRGRSAGGRSAGNGPRAEGPTDSWPGGGEVLGFGGATPFRASGVADRGPLERGTPPPEPRARDAREFERQAEWRASATRAIATLHSEVEAEADGDAAAADAMDEVEDTPGVTPGSPATMRAALDEGWMGHDDGDDRIIRLGGTREEPIVPLETINVLGFGVSRKRLEQAIRDLRLPVLLVRDAEDADVVITLRNHYRQKAPALREAEERGLPVFVLKANTAPQIEACLTSLFALETDPDEAGLREVEEAIGMVRAGSRPVELSPQNASVRRLQHLAVERANLVSVSSGREPYRRVRVYPEAPRAWR